MKIVSLNPYVYVGDHFYAFIQVKLTVYDGGNYRQQWCSRGAMPWSGGAEPNSATGAPISASSVVLLYVKHVVGASAHDEALSGTLLDSGGLGAVLAFRPRHTLSCITHYVESNNVMARWECTLQKVRRKDVVPYMGELEVIVAVFEERSTRWRR
jgi:hypothetical protein